MTPDAAPRTATSAILVAAGESTRMGPTGGERKPLLALGGRLVIEHACAAFAACEAVREIVLVAHPQDVVRLRARAAHSPEFARVGAVVSGGASRTESVRRGVAAASGETELIAVHDAARPLVTTELIERTLQAAAEGGAALAALPLADTVKVSSDGERVDSTLDRSVLWSAQTPQVFRAALLRELLERAAAENLVVTDDAALCEHYGQPVTLVEGEPSNIKLTAPADLELAAAILRSRGEREVRGS
ncbi:MAG: 2-C-methyl-D-erythritol 4-phosphate cytidylyltransferase [Planctomycetota bacterium]|jgi:2-C-methyl-D-erythritol 4-phosphate cytidylyltransferase|nr:2-C-methyl-D-erythritol 4-phosphate cytidylyltransferase [Planctomycetota bacterium]MDP6762850.1 2-C-methyl-D-erythritol 4-phosphate cytidylyltransferase [Planctomycetota bacterium]MDP6990437.1 2-C-methyl-D-erythritol 4-phosphate cytidylyltransferase [Planctomycetota bacterium]